MKNAKKLLSSIIIILILAIMVCLLIYIHHNAAEIGNNVGTATGKIVGNAIGSFDGVTEGVPQGIADGEAAGLSAVDTTADIKGTMKRIGKLEVLIAGVTLENINQIGEAYKGLYLIDGDAVFTVNLNDAEISYGSDGGDIYIWIPEPELTLYLDVSNTQKLAEIQNFSWTVSAEDGLTEYLNSMSNIVENSEDAIKNYDSLMDTAKSAAETRIEQLATTVCGSAQTVHVQFK